MPYEEFRRLMQDMPEPPVDPDRSVPISTPVPGCECGECVHLRREAERLRQATVALPTLLETTTRAFESLRETLERMSRNVQEGTQARNEELERISMPRQVARPTGERPNPTLESVPIDRTICPIVTITPSFRSSVERHGILQPVAGIRRANGDVEIVAGRRRLAAAVELGMSHIPVLVFPLGTDRVMAASVTLVENLHCRPNPVAEYRAIRDLMDSGMNEAQIAIFLNIPVATIRARIRIANLIPPLMLAVETNQLSPSLANTVCRWPIGRQERLVTIAREALDDGDSITGTQVRQARNADQDEATEDLSIPLDDLLSDPPANPLGLNWIDPGTGVRTTIGNTTSATPVNPFPSSPSPPPASTTNPAVTLPMPGGREAYFNPRLNEFALDGLRYLPVIGMGGLLEGGRRWRNTASDRGPIPIYFNSDEGYIDWRDETYRTRDPVDYVSNGVQISGHLLPFRELGAGAGRGDTPREHSAGC